MATPSGKGESVWQASIKQSKEQPSPLSLLPSSHSSSPSVEPSPQPKGTQEAPFASRRQTFSSQGISVTKPSWQRTRVFSEQSASASSSHLGISSRNRREQEAKPTKEKKSARI